MSDTTKHAISLRPGSQMRRAARTTRVGIRASLTTLVVGVLVVLMSTSVSARWSTLGVGTGTASTGTLSAPTSTTASSTAGSGAVNVSWTAPATGIAPTGYNVSRVPSAGSPVSVCGTSTTPVAGPSCTDTSVPDGTYTYVVTSIRGSWTAVGTASSAVTVTNSIATTTAVTSSANPSVVGQTVTYTATVTHASGATKPTGSVTFKDGTSTISCTGGTQTLSAGTATCSLSYTGVGTHSITAVYPGGGAFAGSTSTAITQTVNKMSTTTTLTSSPSPSVTGQTVTFTATVAVVSPGSGTPTGTVSFAFGGSPITCTGGTQTLDGAGVATCQVALGAAGTNNMVATYAGSTTYATSTGTVSQVVNKAGTTTALGTSRSPERSGTPVTYTATVTATSPGAGTPTGNVVFKDGTTTITCTGGNQTLNSSGVATCQVTYGSAAVHSISAVYAGDNNYSTSTSATLTQRVVNSAVTGLGFANVVAGGASVTLNSSNCTGLGTANVVCTINGTANSAGLSADVRFVNASNTLTAYSAENVQGSSAIETKAGTTNATVTFGTNGSGGTLSGTKNGNDHVYFTVTYTDGLNTFTATLKMN